MARTGRNGNGNGNSLGAASGATAGVSTGGAELVDGEGLDEGKLAEGDGKLTDAGGGAAPPKPKFGVLYRAAIAIREEAVSYEQKAKEAKGKLSDALKEIVGHHGSGPWTIDGRTVQITNRKGEFHFRGLKEAPAMSLDEE